MPLIPTEELMAELAAIEAESIGWLPLLVDRETTVRDNRRVT